ncbi:hypothetical protein PYW08_000249 [Mythimna loreyi]|uniref:Uncharacterized protein n=1 Tax=Mythimna loreyi TaxID=667449 RepID=A0ACC2RAQ3_9NEOP|nr:hypothetical protein PYW08_000249 [Mythimna loreyi]
MKLLQLYVLYVYFGDDCGINMFLKILLVYVLHIRLTDAVPSIISKISGRVHNVPYHLRKINYDLICRLQPNRYVCDEEHTYSKFYFDVNMKTCMTFFYNDCDLSHNQFDMLKECNNICYDSMLADDNVLKNLTMDVICSLQPDSGTCNKYYPRYYYDISDRLCKGFSYSGCDGNYNRFETELECKNVCNEAVKIPHANIYKASKK